MDKEWITSDMQRRAGDKVWGLRDPAGQPRIALLREGQSRYSARMTRRMAGYMHWLGEALDRHDLRQANGAPLELVPRVFHVGSHPWATPWYVYERSDQMYGAMGFREGATIDTHAFAQRARPAANLVSGIIAWELDCLRREGCTRQVSQATRRYNQGGAPASVGREPCHLARGPRAVPGDARARRGARGLALRPEAFASLAALEADMVALGEARKTRGNSARNRAWHKAGNKKKRIIWLNSSVCSGAKRQAKPSGNS